VVKKGARVEDSCLMDGVTVEGDCVVIHSIVGRRNRLGRGCQLLEMTVTGSDVTIKDECILKGNLVSPGLTIEKSPLKPGII
jgi:NDP-sugar pyrophosphorylase family protein